MVIAPSHDGQDNGSPSSMTEIGHVTSMAPPRATVYTGPSEPRAKANPSAVKYAPSKRPAASPHRKDTNVGNATCGENGATAPATAVATARTARPAPRGF